MRNEKAKASDPGREQSAYLEKGSSRRSFVSLPVERPIDEETLPHYDMEQFYPVNIGDVFNDRYRVTGKLGFGAYSTSWLCRDMRSQSYVVLKVSTSLRKFPTATDREAYDSFELPGHAGKHRCLILKPMHMTLLEMMRLTPRPFDVPLLKMTLRRLLLALDFLHTEANITHTDLKTDNLMLSLEDDRMLADFANEEIRQPSPRKKIDDLRTIYQSRRFRRPSKGQSFGLPILCDLGEARIGPTHESGPFVQPNIYRAPEVIFEMAWGSSADIWNLGALIWDLFEGCHLFGDIFDDNGNHDPFKHLALMVALIGPPPIEFVQRSETTGQCFDHNVDFFVGAWVAHEESDVPLTSLESLEKRLSGTEKEFFLRFLRSMLKWLPEERKTARQLLDDPWLV
ncbi:protein kinase [Aspergillus violaceofuscus CBS 115571]|uniref:Protein kinase n=1 Tax=Aspergillus violaceofuscus (strain CBS 115571) TaxID=1450538 RepID=A0A2V5H2M3_ASPV1|nr:protein kinase [Aspergillus violaceofuscus CBS 115571]